MALDKALAHMENTVKQLQNNIAVHNGRIAAVDDGRVHIGDTVKYRADVVTLRATEQALLDGYNTALEMLRTGVC